MIDLSSYKARLRTLIPADWTARVGLGKLGIGYDQATTENELSNPACITVTEREGQLFMQRLIVRFKSGEYKVRLALVELILDDLAAIQRRARRLVIDATSEKGAAQQARDQFRGRVPVEYYVASANVEHNRQKYLAKTLLCESYRQSFEDNAQAMPPDAWLLADHSLVKTRAGRFEVEEDASGNHGDAWMSGMFSQWALISKSERAELFAVDITGRGNVRPAPGLASCFQRTGRRGGPLLA